MTIAKRTDYGRRRRAATKRARKDDLLYGSRQAQSRTSSGMIAAVELNRRIFALRRAGKTLREIGEEVGMKFQTVSRIITDYILETARLTAEDAETLRQIELDRLDQLHQAHWDKAIDGGKSATELILRIMDQRDKYKGLDVHKQSSVQSSGDAVGEIRIQLVGSPNATQSSTTQSPATADAALTDSGEDDDASEA
jgi:hypothetical protein